MSPFAALGLSDDADERQIKRAYAAALRKTRPDEDPLGFQHLNEAYQAALEHSRRRVDDVSPRSASAAVVATDESTLDSAGGPAAATPVPSPPSAYEPPRSSWSSGPIVITPDPAHPASHPQEFLTTPQLAQAVLDAATQMPAEPFARWLRDYPPLYSLERKHEVAIALVQLLTRQPSLNVPTLDALAEFFDLDAIDVYPPQIHSIVQSLHSRARFDFERFRTELVERCRNPAVGEFQQWLYAQTELHDPWVRHGAGQNLHAWLMRDDLPYIPSPLMNVISAFFGYEDGQFLHDRSSAQWSIETDNTGHWGEHSRVPMRQLKRRFGLIRAAFIACFIPGLPQRIARVALRVIERYRGIPSLLDERQCRFFIDFARMDYLGPWRWVAVAVRGAALAAAIMAIGEWLFDDPGIDLALIAASMMMLMNLVTIGFNYLRVRIARYRRRRAAEAAAAEPAATPRRR